MAKKLAPWLQPELCYMNHTDKGPAKEIPPMAGISAIPDGWIPKPVQIGPNNVGCSLMHQRRIGSVEYGEGLTLYLDGSMNADLQGPAGESGLPYGVPKKSLNLQGASGIILMTSGAGELG